MRAAREIFVNHWVIVFNEALHYASLHVEILGQKEQKEDDKATDFDEERNFVQFVTIPCLVFKSETCKNEQGHHNEAHEIGIHRHVGFVAKRPRLHQNVR